MIRQPTVELECDICHDIVAVCMKHMGNGRYTVVPPGGWLFGGPPSWDPVGRVVLCSDCIDAGATLGEAVANISDPDNDSG